MNSKEIVHLVGPSQPSGMTWLVNCLLELGVESTMQGEYWNPIGNGYLLKREWYKFARLIPSLLDVDRIFYFRNDIKVYFSHSWYREDMKVNRTILFTRDPKTAFYSHYIRKNHGETFVEFLERPDDKWLINKMYLWNLWHSLWLTHPNLLVITFEDYKLNPESTLKRVINWLGIDNYPDKEITSAVNRSTSEKAREAEDRYLAIHSDTLKTFRWSRSSSVKPEEPEKLAEGYSKIQAVCSPLYQKIASNDFSDIRQVLQPDLFIAIKKRFSPDSDVSRTFLETYQTSEKHFSLIQSITPQATLTLKAHREKRHFLRSYSTTVLRNLYFDLASFHAFHGLEKRAIPYYFMRSIVDLLVQKMKRGKQL